MKLSKINFISFISGGCISMAIFLSSQIFLLWSFQCSIDTIHCYRFILPILFVSAVNFYLTTIYIFCFLVEAFLLRLSVFFYFYFLSYDLHWRPDWLLTWHLLITASWAAGIGITVCSIIRIFLPLPFSSFIFPPQLLPLFSYFLHCLHHF